MKDYAYLDIIERALDSAQREVCFTTDNAVIAAGAGSGKTQVLATRFAWLVISQGIKASEILTLTFTDKAASEMYQRIYGTLKYFAEYTPKTDDELAAFFKQKRKIEEPTDEQIQEFRLAEKDLTEDKKQRAAEALKDFTNAHIQTLDSYCASIVRQCANRYGIRPDFSTGSGDGLKDIKNRAFAFAIKYIDQPCVQEFSEAGRIQDFAENLLADAIISHTSVATPDGYFFLKFQEQKTKVANAWNETFIKNKTESFPSILNEIKKSLNDYSGKITPEKQAWISKVNSLVEKGFEFCKVSEPIKSEDFDLKYEKMNEGCKKLYNFFDILTEIPTRVSIEPAKSLVKMLKDSVSEKFCALAYFITTYKKQVSLMHMLDTFLSEINSLKRMTGSLTFNDVSELALKILQENEDIRNNEKNSYKKIMIDEFQDNNSKNRDLLYLLSLKKGAFESKEGTCMIKCTSEPNSLHDLITDQRDPDKLFFVGDEKQSIYKFRDADVSVFNGLTTENKRVFMSYNYRSSAELIKAFNIFFKNENGIFMSPAQNSADDFEAHYTEEAKKNGMEELPELTVDNVPIHVRFINEKLLLEDPKTAPDYIPKSEQEAYFIAESIYQTAKKEFKDIPCEKWPWNKFAILDKSRSKRDILSKYLSLFNIPFQVDQFKNIFEEGIINDIYNFLRICVYPSDINAFAAYLCSPLGGLSESSVETVLSLLGSPKSGSFSEPKFVFNPFDKTKDQNLSSSMPPSEFKKFCAARDFFENTKKKVLNQELTETLSCLWHERGYKYETMLSAHTRLCAEHFDMLFELARTCDEAEKNASWFIDELERLKKNSLSGTDSEIDTTGVSYPLERASAVQIMTIHKSKGLQFDHVYVFGCTNIKTKTDRAKYTFFEKTGLSVKPADGSPNYFKLCAKAEENLKELAEFRRLIYVAITRAIKDVYILGRIDKRDMSSVEFRLIPNMVLSLYPDVETKNDYALLQTVYNKGAPFDYQAITPVKYTDLPKSTENIGCTRLNVLNAMQDNYDKIQPADPNCHGWEHKQPSKLNQSNGKEENEDDSIAAEDIYPNLTAILKKYSPDPKSNLSTDEEIKLNSENQDQLRNSNFGATDFGTLVHDYLCKMAQGVDITHYEPVPEKNYFRNLSAIDKQEIISICIKMCTQFKNTSFSQEFFKAKAAGRLAKAEYEFKMFYKDALFRGSVDLIYENEDGTYTIVDYKTDRTIKPEEHYEQQKCYKIASEDIVPHPGNITCILYYLRFDKAVPLEV
ncbi:MAG: UvrD-helicase domain-containing protein [Treponema sp.]|nr:UvrD-helicase domain-containing protein [Treponema sp.]